MKSTHRRSVLQNVSICDTLEPIPTIIIYQGDVDWNDAYANWLAGKNPTDSPEWKKGVYLHFEQIEEDEEPSAPTSNKFKRIALCLALVLFFIVAVAIVRHYKGLKNDSAGQHSSAVPVRLPEGYASGAFGIAVCRQSDCQPVS
jgi:hypothetical protein